jgi:hypothetical protein
MFPLAMMLRSTVTGPARRTFHGSQSALGGRRAGEHSGSRRDFIALSRNTMMKFRLTIMPASDRVRRPRRKILQETPEESGDDESVVVKPKR